MTSYKTILELVKSSLRSESCLLFDLHVYNLLIVMESVVSLLGLEFSGR